MPLQSHLRFVLGINRQISSMALAVIIFLLSIECLDLSFLKVATKILHFLWSLVSRFSRCAFEISLTIVTSNYHQMGVYITAIESFIIIYYKKFLKFLFDSVFQCRLLSLNDLPYN